MPETTRPPYCSDFANIQNGLRMLSKSLCEQPNPRIALAYTYLMAWYVMHCPSMMDPAKPWDPNCPAFIQHLDNCKWTTNKMFFICKTLINEGNYIILRCYPQIANVHEGQELIDASECDSYISLSPNELLWLLNIRLEYHIFR